jgi:hypothetical protein
MSPSPGSPILLTKTSQTNFFIGSGARHVMRKIIFIDINISIPITPMIFYFILFKKKALLYGLAFGR